MHVLSPKTNEDEETKVTKNSFDDVNKIRENIKRNDWKDIDTNESKFSNSVLLLVVIDFLRSF